MKRIIVTLAVLAVIGSITHPLRADTPAAPEGTGMPATPAVSEQPAPEAAKASEPTSTAKSQAAEAAEADCPNPPCISYVDADLQIVLRDLATKAGINILIGDEVTGRVTVNLTGIPYQEAMKHIVEMKGYAMASDKNIIKIRSKDALAMEPVEVQVKTLNYAKASEVVPLILPALSKQGKAQVDNRSNSLIVSDTPTALRAIMALADQLDTQTPQVMIEAKFVETTKNPKKDLGINWSGTLVDHPLSAGQFSLQKNLAGGNWLPSTALLDAGDVRLLFSYLATDSDTELLANPRVVTTDNGKAKISIAREVPIPEYSFNEQTGAFVIQGFEYKQIGIILDVSPRINKNEFVTLDVKPEASSAAGSVNFQGAPLPVVDTRQASTSVLIKSGNTLAIGGLMRQDVTEEYTKVPIMGDIPGLGVFFRSKKFDKAKRDLLIFLTPTIIGAESQSTGYEKYYNGFPEEEVYVDDKWMPKDNARPRDVLKLSESSEDRAREKVTTNFTAKERD